MKKDMIIILFFTLCLFSSCRLRTHDYDPGKDSFCEEFQKMYTIHHLTDHFPQSWNEISLRTNKWSSRYCCCEDDSLYHNFSCLGVFVDNISLSNIDSLVDGIAYIDKYEFKSSESIKINFFYIKDEDSYKQVFYDTIQPPIYDFRNADFNMGIVPDSVFSMTPYGHYYVRNDKENLPADLVVYVIDAQPGNFWRNKELADKEPRPVLPEKWKHGYSRGIGVSRSCERVCWWVMAW